jgi:Ca2+/H+ antiporter, TMEM165/GDT1 family
MVHRCRAVRSSTYWLSAGLARQARRRGPAAGPGPRGRVGETFDLAIMPGRRRPRPGPAPQKGTRPLSLTAALVTFGVIFIAELPDKTLVASLVLGSRYRPLHVWAGVAAAFAVHVTIAVAAGSALTLLPGRTVDAVATVLFAAGAVLVLREGREADAGEAADPPAGATAGATAGSSPSALGRTGFKRVAATSFAVVFVAEFGDLTQISTANLAARFGAPVAVWFGSLLALWTVAAIAIAGGRGLLRIMPIRVITRVSAAAFTVLAVLSLLDAVRG